MAAPAFSSRSDCPIPFVPDIVPDLIKDCDVPPAPPPYWQAPTFPPIIPPIVLGCPPIKINTSANPGVTFIGTSTSYDPDGDECFPEINLSLNVPGGGCPIMTVVEQPPPLVAAFPDYTLQVNKVGEDEEGVCEFEFDLNITFVCTDMTIRKQDITRLSFDAEPTLDVSADVLMGGTCDIEFDIDIGIPGFTAITNNNTSAGDVITTVNLSAPNNVLTLTTTAMGLDSSNNETGSGDCIGAVSLDYAAGIYTLNVTRIECSTGGGGGQATYC